MPTLRPVFLTDRRLADAPRVFRPDFAAVFFVVVFFDALRVLAVFALGFADLFAGLFFFGDAAFTFRVFLAFRFLAAPIAAPDRPPMTVPTTGTPGAVVTRPCQLPPGGGRGNNMRTWSMHLIRFPQRATAVGASRSFDMLQAAEKR